MLIEGTGIDLVKVSRIRKLARKWGNRFLEKVFTPQELDYAFQREKPYEHLAARFAAKEAFIKAIRKKVSWKKIGVARELKKAPYFSKCPLFSNQGMRTIHLSMSHTKTEAIALVIVEKSN